MKREVEGGRYVDSAELLCLSVACLIGQVCFLNCFKMLHKSKQKAHRERDRDSERATPDEALAIKITYTQRWTVGKANKQSAALALWSCRGSTNSKSF